LVDYAETPYGTPVTSLLAIKRRYAKLQRRYAKLLAMRRHILLLWLGLGPFRVSVGRSTSALRGAAIHSFTAFSVAGLRMLLA
jgi:hypothetical protein